MTRKNFQNDNNLIFLYTPLREHYVLKTKKYYNHHPSSIMYTVQVTGHYENRGPIKIVTSQWDLTAYVNLHKYNDILLTKTETMCRECVKNSDSNCHNLL